MLLQQVRKENASCPHVLPRSTAMTQPPPPVQGSLRTISLLSMTRSTLQGIDSTVSERTCGASTAGVAHGTPGTGQSQQGKSSLVSLIIEDVGHCGDRRAVGLQREPLVVPGQNLVKVNGAQREKKRTRRSCFMKRSTRSREAQWRGAPPRCEVLQHKHVASPTLGAAAAHRGAVRCAACPYTRVITTSSAKKRAYLRRVSAYSSASASSWFGTALHHNVVWQPLGPLTEGVMCGSVLRPHRQQPRELVWCTECVKCTKW